MRYSRFIILVCIVGSIIILVVFLSPKYFSYKKIVPKITANKIFLENRTLYFQKLTDIAHRLSQESDAVNKIDSIMSEKVNFSSVVNFLDQIGGETGVIVKNINIGNSGTMAGQERIKMNNFSLTVSGSYPAFKNFLDKLENSARLFEVGGFSFSSPSKDTDFFNYNLQLKVYSY